MSEEFRRADDKRLDDLAHKVNRLATDFTQFRDMLISTPDASPLGRALLERAKENREGIRELRRDFDLFRKEEFQPLDDWWNQSRGAWKLVLAVATITGIVGAFFGVVTWLGGHP